MWNDCNIIYMVRRTKRRYLIHAWRRHISVSLRFWQRGDMDRPGQLFRIALFSFGFSIIKTKKIYVHVYTSL